MLWTGDNNAIPHSILVGQHILLPRHFKTIGVPSPDKHIKRQPNARLVYCVQP